MKYYVCCIALLLVGCRKDSIDNGAPTIRNKPNILLIIADDLGVDGTPNYTIGDIKPKMPHLERLAAKGLTFDNFWANPLCSPTRATIFTGKYGYHTGVLNATTAGQISASETSLHKFLDDRDAGYSHALIGKWHLGKDPDLPERMGVGYYAGLLTGGAKSYYNWTFTENGTQKKRTDYITTVFTDLAINWIKEQDSPWFCWLAYTAPHTPLHLPPDSMHSQGNLSKDQSAIDANPLPYYIGMIESLDFEIGRLLTSLSEEELDNTIILFIGDNGAIRKVLQSPYKEESRKEYLIPRGDTCSDGCLWHWRFKKR